MAAPAQLQRPSEHAGLHLRRRLELAIDHAIAALDALDGDADLEPASEDEGAQCDDEGAPEFEFACDYADGGMDQTRLAADIPGVAISPLGAR